MAGLNAAATLVVKSVMKPLHVWMVGVVVVLAACPSHLGPNASRMTRSGRPNAGRAQTETPGSHADRQAIRRAARNLTFWAHDLQATHGGDASGSGRRVGDLWIEVNRLRRGGQNVRAIEWYVSDLEGSLRRGQEDAAARRHILNNLDYEIEVLKRRRH